MRTRTLIFVAGVIAALVPGLVTYGLTRTALFGAMVDRLGTSGVLAIGVLILIALLGSAVFALVYGFAQHDSTFDRRRTRYFRR